MADAPKVATQHEGAQALIGKLREIALEIKELGDEYLKLEREAMSFEEVIAQSEDHEAAVRDWTELLTDFRRGIRDRDELLEGTVGK